MPAIEICSVRYGSCTLSLWNVNDPQVFQSYKNTWCRGHTLGLTVSSGTHCGKSCLNRPSARLLPISRVTIIRDGSQDPRGIKDELLGWYFGVLQSRAIRGGGERKIPSSLSPHASIGASSGDPKRASLAAHWSVLSISIRSSCHSNRHPEALSLWQLNGPLLGLLEMRGTQEGP